VPISKNELLAWISSLSEQPPITELPLKSMLEVKRAPIPEEKRTELAVEASKMPVPPLSKADEIQRHFMEVIGFEEFAGYLNDTDEGKRFFTEARDKIKQLLGS